MAFVRLLKDRPFMAVVGFFLLCGLCLSFLSLSEWCSETCAEVHNFRFFGYPFDLMGIGFFSVALSLWSLNLFSEGKTLYFLGLMLSGAIGAEVWFILIQKIVIQAFCPICLCIAASVLFAAIGLLLEGGLQLKKSLSPGDPVMLRQARRRTIPPLFTLVIGFLIAFFGVLKPESTFAAGSSEKEDPIFGNRSTQIEVYVISDWFCKACRKLEPNLEVILPDVMDKASVIFVDRAIHNESLNFLPYNLSFMLKEKDKYLKIRQAMSALSLKTKVPTQKEIQEAVTSLGVTYQPLQFVDIDSGQRFFQGIAQTFQVNSTPTIVIANKRKVEAKKLIGNEEITKENILSWIDKLK